VSQREFESLAGVNGAELFLPRLLVGILNGRVLCWRDATWMLDVD
jgi:hypothetical protein